MGIARGGSCISEEVMGLYLVLYCRSASPNYSITCTYRRELATALLLFRMVVFYASPQQHLARGEGAETFT